MARRSGASRLREGRQFKLTISDLHRSRKPGRTPLGIAAMLLPFESDGSIAENAYQSLISETYDAGLIPAVNMDTGHVNLLTEEELSRVLALASEAAGGRPFVAGAFIEGLDGNVVDLYRSKMTDIAKARGTPILFQTSRTHAMTPREKVEAYRRASRGFETVYAFELGKMFAPNGEIWDLQTFKGIMEIPEIKGVKHSSLNRMLEFERLQLRDAIRPDFRIFTGNDLGIDMIEFGSDYLLGLAAFSPAKFAERDRLWSEDSLEYLAVADGLQMLGDIAFRPPVPAYKHSCAIFLHLLGKIPSPRSHPRSIERPQWEREIMRDCAVRLGLI